MEHYSDSNQINTKQFKIQYSNILIIDLILSDLLIANMLNHSQDKVEALMHSFMEIL